MRSIRFAVLSNARKYVTERVAKNGRNDLFSVSLELWRRNRRKSFDICGFAAKDSHNSMGF